MTRITIDIADAETREAIGHMLGRLQDPTQALDDIGEYLIVFTKGRFQSGTAPSGEKWKPNAPLTLSGFNEAGAKSPGKP